jgi:cytochrome c-type biogenesis protein CcmH
MIALGIAILVLAGGLGWLLVRGDVRARAPVVVVTMVLGLAAYALAGRPSLPSRPAPPAVIDPGAPQVFEESRRRLLNNYGDVGAWLTFAEALGRQGRTQDAVDGLQVALSAMPDSPDLWVGLGNALTVHGDGMVTPAARLAFDRASQIAPDHPAPRYFLGLAWLQAGKPSEALAVWEPLRASSPPGAPWLPDLDRKIEAAKIMIAAGVGS